MKDIKPKNGKIKVEAKPETAKSPAPPAEAPAPLTTIKLTAQQETELRTISGGAAGARSDISDIQLRILALESERTQRVAALEQAVKNFQERVRALATAHGIDMNSQTERWSFNVDTLTFNRTA